MTIFSLHLTPSIFHTPARLRRFTMETAPYHEERLIKGASPVYFHSSSATGFPLLSAHHRMGPRFSDRFDTNRQRFGILVPLSFSLSLSLSLPVVVKVRYPVGDALSELPIVKANRC